MKPEDLPLANYIDRLQHSLDEVNKDIPDYEYKVKNLKRFYSANQIRAWNKRLKKLYESRKSLKTQIADARKKLDDATSPLHGAKPKDNL